MTFQNVGSKTQFVLEWAFEIEAGCPCRTLRGTEWVRQDATSPTQVSQMRVLQHVFRWEGWFAQPGGTALPLQPLWPGFGINTIFCAALLWLPFAAFGRIRRRRRIKRGLCPACAYPVSDSAVCTECGKAVRPER
jgi:hypothetical protein